MLKERELAPRGPAAGRRGRGWIEHWDPEDETFWQAEGKRIARKNLALSIFTDHLGFCIFVVWTSVVINLANMGIVLTLSQQFLLTLIPNLVGSALRIPYTFALPRFGGRRWTTFSAGVLLLPALLLAVVVPGGWLAHQAPGAQFWVLFACAATAGLGGGIFASSMANISFFYPEQEKGFALGLNAAGGNLGVAVSQLFVPLVIIIGVSSQLVALPKHPVHMAYAGWVFVPLIALAAAGAWWLMDSLREARSDGRAYAMAVRNPATWLLSFLYVGTFGSFIGFSFALPLVIKNTFPEFLGHHPFIATYLGGLGFMGALIGSLARPLGGGLSDRVGGAKVTLAVFAAMAVATAAAAIGVQHRSFGLFFGSYMVVFLLSGLGNGSIYKMIPSVFAAYGRRHAADAGIPPQSVAGGFKRQAAAVIGIAGAIGAFGGVLVQVVFRQASLHVSALVKAATTPAAKLTVAVAHANWSVPALWVFLGAYVVFAVVTWAAFLRRPAEAPI
ncbi:MAG TPA: MFS transporter [Actinomycetota bacterium]|nr:MFS transporter [Actinomycetota bacterium]